MNKPYHRFVFDERGLVGDFEAMYQAEDTEGFDAWGARDPRHLRMRLVTEILSDYNFGNVLDVGCGVGTATQALKKANNRVIAVDVSPTALAKARQSFPDIDFREMSAVQIEQLEFLRFDLITVQMALAYIPEWRRVLEQAATMTHNCLVCEYIPFGSKGAIKSKADLEEAFGELFLIERKVVLNDETLILFGGVK